MNLDKLKAIFNFLPSSILLVSAISLWFADTNSKQRNKLNKEDDMKPLYLMIFTIISFSGVAQTEDADSSNQQEKGANTVAVSQGKTNSVSTEKEQANDEDMERITVLGQDQLIVLRYNYIRAEEDFFDAFNQLASTEDYHISCARKQRHSFTRIKKRKCESAFQSRIQSEVIQEAIRADPAVFLLPSAQSSIYKQQKKVQEKQLEEMRLIVMQNQQLQEKLQSLVNAKRKYNKARGAKENWGVLKE